MATSFERSAFMKCARSEMTSLSILDRALAFELRRSRRNRVQFPIPCVSINIIKNLNCKNLALHLRLGPQHTENKHQRLVSTSYKNSRIARSESRYQLKMPSSAVSWFPVEVNDTGECVRKDYLSQRMTRLVE